MAISKITITSPENSYFGVKKKTGQNHEKNLETAIQLVKER
jgi:hypothetical protein